MVMAHLLDPKPSQRLAGDPLVAAAARLARGTPDELHERLTAAMGRKCDTHGDRAAAYRLRLSKILTSWRQSLGH